MKRNLPCQHCKRPVQVREDIEDYFQQLGYNPDKQKEMLEKILCRLCISEEQIKSNIIDYMARAHANIGRAAFMIDKIFKHVPRIQDCTSHQYVYLLDITNLYSKNIAVFCIKCGKLHELSDIIINSKNNNMLL